MKLKYIISKNTNPYENLAVEEWLTMHAAEGEITLFLWQNENTIVIGRNQNPWKECNVELIKRDGVRLVRRMSGGGAVYHDLGNLNFSFIARDDLYNVEKQTEVVLQAVRMLGIDAEKNGRNDLVADGRKFSGHAYYSSGGFNYHHGTIMLDVDATAMTRYLNVNADKLKSKGVASVRSRVVNLSELLAPAGGETLQPGGKTSQPGGETLQPGGETLQPGGESSRNTAKRTASLVDAMKDALILSFEGSYFCEAEEWARPNYINAKGLDKLLAKYKSDNWNYGTRINFTNEIEHRFDWGSVDIQLEVKGSTITACRIYSDALGAEMIGAISSLLEGMPYDAKEIRGLANSPESRELLDLIAAGIE